MDGFPPNLSRYIIVTSLKAHYILVSLSSFSRSCLTSGISFEPVNGFFSTVHRCITVSKSTLNFSDGDLVLKVRGGLTCIKFSL